MVNRYRDKYGGVILGGLRIVVLFFWFEIFIKEILGIDLFDIGGFFYYIFNFFLVRRVCMFGLIVFWEIIFFLWGSFIVGVDFFRIGVGWGIIYDLG